MRRKFKLFPIILLLILITGCGSTETNLPDSSEATMNQQVMQEVEKLSEEPKTEDEEEEAASETVDAAQQDEADALNHWVLTADPAAMSDNEVDAISSATPQAGSQSFEWDLNDERGNRVPDGSYFIKLEGTLYWSSNVLYMGEIVLPGTVPGELDIQIERSEPENTENVNMIQNVRMTAYDRD